MKNRSQTSQALALCAPMASRIQDCFVFNMWLERYVPESMG